MGPVFKLSGKCNHKKLSDVAMKKNGGGGKYIAKFKIFLWLIHRLETGVVPAIEIARSEPQGYFQGLEKIGKAKSLGPRVRK